MTIQQCIYVLKIAQSGSFNEAAKQLFISQPSLSSSITHRHPRMLAPAIPARAQMQLGRIGTAQLLLQTASTTV